MPEDEEDLLDRLLEEFSSAAPRAANPSADDVDISIPPKILTKIERKHGLSEADVTDIVKGQPPAVVEVRHPDDDEKRLFYGFTRHGRDAFVVGVWADSTTPGRRLLRVVTAFLPDDDSYVAHYFAKVHR